MNKVYTQFAKDMEQIIVFVELFSAIRNLAKHDLKNMRSNHPVAAEAKIVHAKARELSSSAVVVYDGPFLTACAQFEMAVRDMIEAFISNLMRKITDYSHLPKPVMDWHPRGCAQILLNIHQDKFKHLTQDIVLQNLASCVHYSPKKPYRFTLEAFSDNERNLKPDIIEEIFKKRLGIDKIWQKLSREDDLTTYFGTQNSQLVEKLAREKLKEIMNRRNEIIHRGKEYYTPGESEIKECANFFKVLILSFANMLEKHLNAL
jgi:hypothetical protein